MKICPYCKSNEVIKFGNYWVRHRRCSVIRYRCKSCLRTHSSQTHSANRYQKKSHLNEIIFRMLCEGSSMRAIGRVLGISKNTVYAKFIWLSEQKFKRPREWQPSPVIYLDEMESFEHTKLKPLTIAIIADSNYQLLSAKVGTLKAKGLLKDLSLRKYGTRANESSLSCKRVLKKLDHYVEEIHTDDKPSYRKLIRKTLPRSNHQTFLSQKDTLETRYNKKEYDPLFKINQRFAKIRSDMKRLSRRTWCTTKLKENLQRHLNLYMAYNNGWTIN